MFVLLELRGIRFFNVLRTGRVRRTPEKLEGGRSGEREAGLARREMRGGWGGEFSRGGIVVSHRLDHFNMRVK